MKDHFEINLVPLTIGISHVFFKKIMAFCFPEKVTNNDPGSEEVPATKEKKKKGGNKNKKGIGAGAASFYVESPLNKVTDFAICKHLGYFLNYFATHILLWQLKNLNSSGTSFRKLSKNLIKAHSCIYSRWWYNTVTSKIKIHSKSCKRSKF